MNKDVFDRFFNYPKSAFIENLNKPLKKDDIEIGLDMNKCRKNIVYTNKYDYPRISVLDDIVKFDETKHGDIPCGFYYVETKAKLPFKGDGIYSYFLVRKGLEHGIITKNDIKAAIIPKLTVKHDFMNDFIRKVYDSDLDHQY